MMINMNVNGNLTIKGISKEVIIEVEFGGTNTDPGVMKRRDFR